MADRIVVVVPFLNEERLLPTLLESVAAQTRLPDRLVLVDDGSTDASGEQAARFAAQHEFATLLRRPPRAPERDRLARASEMRSFQWATEQLDEPWDVLGKLDADLQLTPDLLETIDDALARDPELGIAGAHLSIRVDGALVREAVPEGHVRGATKFYRRACWEQIAPIEAVLGWDTADEIAARRHGWRVRSVAVPSGDPVHLRPTGQHDGRLVAQRRWGMCAWGYGAHPLHVLLSAVARAGRPPLLLGGLSFLWGWAFSAARRAPRARPEVRRQARREDLQRLRARLTGRGGR